MQIEPESHVPIYKQIVEHLRSSIAAGVYRPGEALPSLRTLATDLRVNPNTVQRAFDELCREGLIESHRGVGMFVGRRGVRSAISKAEKAGQAAFEKALTTAFAAGLDAKRIRELFDAALRAAAKNATVRP